jgi:hypothetical protein
MNTAKGILKVARSRGSGSITQLGHSSMNPLSMAIDAEGSNSQGTRRRRVLDDEAPVLL